MINEKQITTFSCVVFVKWCQLVCERVLQKDHYHNNSYFLSAKWFSKTFTNSFAQFIL